jgi:hypothetical protein
MPSRGPLCFQRHPTHVPQALDESVSCAQQAIRLRRARAASDAMVPGALLGLSVRRAQQADHFGRARAAVVADAGHQPPRAQPRDRLPQLLEGAVLGVGHLRRARSARCSPMACNGCPASSAAPDSTPWLRQPVSRLGRSFAI